MAVDLRVWDERTAAKLLQRGQERLNNVDEDKKFRTLDGIYLCELAGDIFRVVGNWRKSGKAYVTCAEAEKSQGNLLVAASFFAQAAVLLRRIDPDSAVAQYGAAIAIHAELSNFHVAAVLQQEVAEMYEEDKANENASDAYQIAADYYLGEAQFAPAVRCMCMSAECLIKENMFEPAADRFFLAAQYCLDDNLLKLNAAQYMMNSVLCLLCTGDISAAYVRVQECAELDFKFITSKERLFLLDVVEAAKVYNIDVFVDHVWNFDYVMELSPTELRLLRRVGAIIEKGPPVSESEGETSDSEFDSDSDASTEDSATEASESSSEESEGDSEGSVDLPVK